MQNNNNKTGLTQVTVFHKKNVKHEKKVKKKNQARQMTAQIAI